MHVFVMKQSFENGLIHFLIYRTVDFLILFPPLHGNRVHI